VWSRRVAAIASAAALFASAGCGPPKDAKDPGQGEGPASSVAWYTLETEIDGERYSVPGDYARIEADNKVTLLGRGSNCINTGGEKVFPEEVEGVLKGHPAVYDALVVGVPDERWGNAVAAVVQVREGQDAPTLDEVAEHCRSHIAAYKVPRHLLLVPEIQRSPSGKPDYPWASRTAKTELGVS